MIRLYINKETEAPSAYLNVGPILHKCLEVGFQRWSERTSSVGGFDLFWQFRTRGDHAGLRTYLEFFGWLFEFNVGDNRHWDWKKNTWQTRE